MSAFSSRVLVSALSGFTAVVCLAAQGEALAAALKTGDKAPLFTTKSADRGTGLGLAIVRRVVDEHGGLLAVTSTVGTGTVFRIRVPLAVATTAIVG